MRFAWLLPLLLLCGCAESMEPARVLPAESAVKPVLVLAMMDAAAHGPVLGYDGSVYFSLRNSIRIVTPNGSHRVWARAAAPRGHIVMADGFHIVCDAGRPGVVRISPLGERIGSVIKTSGGEALKGPYDLVVDQWSGFYFTDSSGPADQAGAIHYVLSNRGAGPVIDGLAAPTGLAISADWRRLLVIENGHHRIVGYSITSQGRLSERSVFAELPAEQTSRPDGLLGGGLAFDTEGNLYVAYEASDSVVVFDSNGTLLRRYRIGQPTTGVCFGGPQMDQLFVTVAGPASLFRLNLGVRGVDQRPRR